MRRLTRPMLVLLVAILVLAAGPAAQKTDSAQALLRAATDKAIVDGDLSGAIKQFQTIVEKFKTDRAVVATALVRMAECYQKLGDAQARKIYERVVREYADQRDPVAQARSRLAVLQDQRTPPVPSGIVTRQVWTGPQVDVLGSVSPDGRFVSFVDWQTGDLAVRDLTTGDNRRLTNKGGFDQSPEFALFSRISPDGRLIAYNWMTRTFGWEIRVGPVDGSSYRTRFSSNTNDVYAQPETWSPDGKQLAVLLFADGISKMGLIDVAGGLPRVLKSFDWRSPGSMLFSPDGKYIAYSFPPAEDSSEGDIYVLAVDGSREARLVEHPADDHLLAWMPDGRILFASDRSGTTDVWTLAVSEGKPRGAAELLKKDMGSVFSLGFTRAGSLYYGLRLGGKDVYTLPLDPQTGQVVGTPFRVAQRFVGTNGDPDWSPDGRRLVYVSDRSAPSTRIGAVVLCIADLESGLRRELPIRLGYVARPRWSPDGRSILFRANDEKGRTAFFVADADTGRTTLLVRRQGLSRGQWSRDGKTVFVLTTDFQDAVNKTGQASWIVARDVTTGEEKELFRETAPAPMGDVQVNDLAVSPDGRLLAFTVVRNKSKAVMILPSEGGEPREIFRAGSDFQIPNFAGLAWTPDGSAILLLKTGGDGQQELWALPARGGEPRPLGLGMRGLRMPAVHPSGRQIAFQAGVGALDMWALENLPRPVR